MLTKIKNFFIRTWSYVPRGWMCRFWHAGTRITFYRTGWIVIDSGRGTVKDMLPCTLVSEQVLTLIDDKLCELGYPEEK